MFPPACLTCEHLSIIELPKLTLTPTGRMVVTGRERPQFDTLFLSLYPVKNSCIYSQVPAIVSFRANQMFENILEFNKVAAMREEMREVVAKEVAALREEVIFKIIVFVLVICVCALIIEMKSLNLR